MTKPARRYITRAVPQGDGFLAEFAFPGGVPDLVRSHGRPLVFATEAEANAAAGQTLCDTLNSRVRDRKDRKDVYQRMTPVEVANGIADAGVSWTWFAWIYGTHTQRVMKWIEGDEDVPHPVRVVLALLRLPGAVEEAERITSIVTERRPDHAKPST